MSFISKFSLVILLLLAASSVWGQGLFAPFTSYNAQSYTFYACASDLNGDGYNDLIATRWITDTTLVTMQNNGDGTFQPAVFNGVGNEQYSAVAADFDNDGDNDIALATNSGLAILKNNGNGTFAPRVKYSIANSGCFGLVAADIDEDSDIDLIITVSVDDKAFVFKNDGLGNFNTHFSYDCGPSPYGLAAADLNGDGEIDLAVANGEGNRLSLLFGNGTGGFNAPVPIALDSTPFNIVAIDLDGDNDKDLAVAYMEVNHISVIFNNGDGSFAVPVNLPSGLYPQSICAADFDLDGDPDLAVCNANSSNISVYLNDGGGTFAAPDYYPSGPIPFSVFPSDLDGDGDMDLVCASLTNNVYIFQNQTITPTADVWPPASVGDLRTSVVEATSVTLEWTAPGNNGYSGTASTYDLRYSETPITTENWGLAAPVSSVGHPGTPGSTASFTVTGLSPLTAYYFAIKTADEVPNWSELSNVVRVDMPFLCGDVNRDKLLNIMDIVYLINTVYRGGPKPHCQ
jgi:FG-GAP-like repeat/Fibronectin type III domain